MSWLPVCALDEVPILGSRPVCLAIGRIAIFRTGDDQVFALNDRCPHRNGPLSQGIVHGKHVTCPLHDWVIELDTGSAVAPDEGQVTRHRTRVVDGWIEIRIDAAAEVAR